MRSSASSPARGPQSSDSREGTPSFLGAVARRLSTSKKEALQSTLCQVGLH